MLAALLLALSNPTLMFVAFDDGTSMDDIVEYQVCEKLNEEVGRDLTFVYAYWPPTGQLKRIIMVICHRPEDRE